MVYVSGEKPGEGIYQCLECGTLIVIDDDMKTLPFCPNCKRNFFKKEK